MALLQVENLSVQFGYGDESTPAMDSYYDESFSLPMFPALKDDEQTYVIKKLLEFLHA